jgi:hypothetical protein
LPSLAAEGIQEDHVRGGLFKEATVRLLTGQGVAAKYGFVNVEDRLPGDGVMILSFSRP